MKWQDDLQRLDGDFYLSGISAYKKYHGNKPGRIIFLKGSEESHQLAKVFSSFKYPGLLGIDGIVSFENLSLIYRTMDSYEYKSPITLLNISFNLKKHSYHDPFDFYQYLKTDELTWDWDLIDCIREENQAWLFLLDVVSILSVRDFNFTELVPIFRSYQLSVKPENQKILLEAILPGNNAHRSLEFLAKIGFIKEHWPLLADLDEIEHAKEHHPEGNGWEHTLQALTYRKTGDYHIALALLLHDTGKSHAQEVGGNRFNDHAQLGVSVARRFLRELEYGNDFIEEICFLVGQHMLPAFISRLPINRIRRSMEHEFFPKLLEVYRCDLLSTYRGPEDYFEACRTYRRFIRNKKNPFRSPEGNKAFKLYVE